jgi:predicted CoA-binding protein
MTTQAAIHDFMSEKRLAFVGLSRFSGKFSRTAYTMLRERGYLPYPINPHTGTIDGEPCFHSFAELPEKVENALIMTPSFKTAQVVREANEAGIRRLWIQQGSESEAALRYCEAHGISVIHGQCILMYAEPVKSFHKLHRWVWKAIGKCPAESPHARPQN